MSKEEGCEGRGVNGCVVETLVLRFIWLVDDKFRWTNRAFVLCSIPAPADWLEAKWSAGECLTYVGGFVAALAAVVDVYATIIESRLSEERQLRESVAPCIALTLLKNGTLAEGEQDDEESAFPKISLNQEPYYKACRHLANTPLLENHVAISAVSATASVELPRLG